VLSRWSKLNKETHSSHSSLVTNNVADTNTNYIICGLPERFASAWPELIIACDVRGRGEWLHRCSWPPLQLAYAAYKLFADAFQACRLQTDRKTDITTWLHMAPFALQAADAKTQYKRGNQEKINFNLTSNNYKLRRFQQASLRHSTIRHSWLMSNNF